VVDVGRLGERETKEVLFSRLFLVERRFESCRNWNVSFGTKRHLSARKCTASSRKTYAFGELFPRGVDLGLPLPERWAWFGVADAEVR